MSRRIVFGLVAALVSTGAVVAASQPPEAVREAVRSEIAQAMGPLEAGDPPHPDPTGAMFQRIDINRDGVTDWRIDFGKAPNASYFCGTGGCRQRLYVSTPGGGYDLVFDNTVRQFKLHRSKGQPVLDVDFHGSTCGGFGVDPCPRSYGWSQADGRFLERPASSGRTFLIGGPAQPVLRPEASLPAPVRAIVAAKVKACQAVGGAYPYADAYVTDVADLNGDTVRDWVVGGGYDACAFIDTAPDNAPVFPTEVFVSGPGGFASAYRDDVPVWGLDLTGGSAAFVTLQGAEDCGLNGKDCQQTRWRWDGAALVSKAPERP
jgi:hypothetical protein